ncbi:MAG: hypothetical protein NC417_03925 [Candidatus Gastranaerophilales bacterium]|nr:hypothetical protein [Candidatus Gastranaerophilales bacterium]
MSKFEKKFGKYAIPNITLVLIICYIVGYAIEMINGSFLFYLTLDPYRILHGQVWRLFTWVIVPPSSPDLFTIIMLFFYYSIGTALERTWGTYRYNVYLFSGMLFTIVGSFLCLIFCYLLGGGADMGTLFAIGAFRFSTYYINLSIYLAFAATYPEARVLLMFVIPVKVKWMGILDIILMVYTLFVGDVFTKFAVVAALINFVVFYLVNIKRVRLAPKQIKRRAQFKQETRRANAVTKHKCAVCGQTDEDAPELQFRFCSKCNGNYEYCQNHLFTHTHVK